MEECSFLKGREGGEGEGARGTGLGRVFDGKRSGRHEQIDSRNGDGEG